MLQALSSALYPFGLLPSISNSLQHDYIAYICCMSYLVGVEYLCYYTESKVKWRTGINNKGILQLL